LPDGTADARIRPNQIFAVSLGNSPLNRQQQRSVVKTVQKYLLTDYGLRTLSAEDAGYIGRYEGSGFERDRAYHQGTVWPYLIGPFIEAYLRVNDFSAESRQESKKMLEPLLEHLTQSGCIGSISEVFDGDSPQEPKGCFAQAWSVAEVLRAWMLING
jgi:glycogen debranching enzyme